MTRFVLSLVIVAAVGVLTLTHQYGWALLVGVLAGAGLFLVGMAVGGTLGNARQFGQKPADVSTRVGVCLAAMGIAASAVGNEHYPPAFHVFFGILMGLAALIALVLSGRAARVERNTQP